MNLKRSVSKIICAVLIATITASMLPMVAVFGSYNPGPGEIGLRPEIIIEGGNVHLDFHTHVGAGVGNIDSIYMEILYQPNKVDDSAMFIPYELFGNWESLAGTFAWGGEMPFSVDTTQALTGTPGNARFARVTFPIIDPPTQSSPIEFTVNLLVPIQGRTSGGATLVYPNQILTVSYPPPIAATPNVTDATVASGGVDIPAAGETNHNVVFNIEGEHLNLTNAAAFSATAAAAWVTPNNAGIQFDATTQTVTVPITVPNYTVQTPRNTTLQLRWNNVNVGTAAPINQLAFSPNPPVITGIALEGTAPALAANAGNTNVVFVVTGTDFTTANLTAGAFSATSSNTAVFPNPTNITVANVTSTSARVTVQVNRLANNTTGTRDSTLTLNNTITATQTASVELTQAGLGEPNFPNTDANAATGAVLKNGAPMNIVSKDGDDVTVSFRLVGTNLTTVDVGDFSVPTPADDWITIDAIRIASQTATVIVVEVDVTVDENDTGDPGDPGGDPPVEPTPADERKAEFSLVYGNPTVVGNAVITQAGDAPMGEIEVEKATAPYSVGPDPIPAPVLVTLPSNPGIRDMHVRIDMDNALYGRVMDVVLDDALDAVGGFLSWNFYEGECNKCDDCQYYNEQGTATGDCADCVQVRADCGLEDDPDSDCAIYGCDPALYVAYSGLDDYSGSDFFTIIFDQNGLLPNIYDIELSFKNHLGEDQPVTQGDGLDGVEVILTVINGWLEIAGVYIGDMNSSNNLTSRDVTLIAMYIQASGDLSAMGILPAEFGRFNLAAANIGCTVSTADFIEEVEDALEEYDEVGVEDPDWENWDDMDGDGTQATIDEKLLNVGEGVTLAKATLLQQYLVAQVRTMCSHTLEWMENDPSHPAHDDQNPGPRRRPDVNVCPVGTRCHV